MIKLIEDNHLRIDEGVFRRQLLHDEGLILGAYDARLTGRDGEMLAMDVARDGPRNARSLLVPLPNSTSLPALLQRQLMPSSRSRVVSTSMMVASISSDCGSTPTVCGAPPA